MRSRVIIFVGKKTKSWAIGCEIAVRLSKEGYDVVLCHTTWFSPILRPISLHRRLNQFVLKHRYKYKTKVLRMSSVKTFSILFFQALRVLKTTYVFDSTTERILSCHFAPYLGTDTASLYSVGRLKLFTSYFRYLALSQVTSKFLAKCNAIDSTYLFNGRELVETTIINQLRRRQIKIYLYERASKSSHYEIYNQSPHKNEEWWEKITNYKYDKELMRKSHEDGEIQAYIKQKMNGTDPFTLIKWGKYLDENLDSAGFLPEKYVVFFSVSTSEFSPFPEYNSKAGFRNQFDALKHLLVIATKNKVGVVIRRHPNSLSLGGADKEHDLWSEFISSPNVYYFSPTSRVDSYLLAEKSLAVFTWRSTIGFDTLCRGLPTFAMGPAKWALDERVRAWNELALESIFNSGYKFPQVNDLVEKYAFYMSSFGTEFEEFEFVERWGYKLRSRKVTRNYLFQRVLGIPRTL